MMSFSVAIPSLTKACWISFSRSPLGWNSVAIEAKVAPLVLFSSTV